MKRAIALAGVMLLASVASAQTWTESGDAPDLLPAQDCVGTGPITLINGSLSSGADADLFGIMVTDYTAFRATTVGLTTADTRLYIFDPVTGNGISMNDDDPGGAGLQSTVTGAFLTGNGYYAVGVSPYANNPQNPSGLDIWLSSPYGVERAPDGPGAPGPLAMWSYGGYDSGGYGIALTGAEFVPEPGSLSLLALGALALLRRR